MTLSIAIYDIPKHLANNNKTIFYRTMDALSNYRKFRIMRDQIFSQSKLEMRNLLKMGPRVK